MALAVAGRADAGEASREEDHDCIVIELVLHLGAGPTRSERGRARSGSEAPRAANLEGSSAPFAAAAGVTGGQAPPTKEKKSRAPPPVTAATSSTAFSKVQWTNISSFFLSSTSS